MLNHFTQKKTYSTPLDEQNLSLDGRLAQKYWWYMGVLALTLFGLGVSTASMAGPQYQNGYNNGYYVQPRSEDYRRYPGQGRLVCQEVQVRHIRSSDHDKIAGTAIGAVAGGLLGNTIGRGSGRTLATVGGAVAGGFVGRKVQENHQDRNAYYTTERRCWRQY